MRTLGIGVEGLSAEEAEYRRSQKLRIMNLIEPYAAGIATIPGLGPHHGFREDQQFVIRIPSDLLHIVAEKVVRGCEFVIAERIIEKPFEVLTYFAHENEIPDILVKVLAHPNAQKTDVGPGFNVVRAEAHDEPGNVIYKITIWDSLVIYGSILSPAEVAESRPANPMQS